jgi:competence protein ComEC
MQKALLRTARARAWGAFGAFALGVTLSHELSPRPGIASDLIGDTPISAIGFALAGLFASQALILPRRAALVSAMLAFVLLGAGLHHARLRERPRDDLLRLIGPGAPGDALPMIRVEGVALGAPSFEPPRPGSIDEAASRHAPAFWSVPLRLDTRIDESGAAVRVSGRARVFAPGLDESGLRPGDRVRVLGLLHRPAPAMNPGQPDPADWAAQGGRVGWIRAAAGSIEPRPPRGVSDQVHLFTAWLSDAARSSARRLLPSGDDSPAAGVLAAMLLGERTDPDRQALFARTGVAHLLAISGFHLAVLVGLTVGVVRLLGDRPRLEAAIGLYLLVVPARTPIVRAGALAGAMLGANFFLRRWDRLTLLGWVATVIVAFRPLDLFTLGFQLTVGVTALLLWLGEGPHPWIAPRPRRIDGAGGRAASAARWGRELVVTSVLVWLASAPVIAWHTGSFNPITPFAVIVSTPIATLLQILGMGGVVVGLFSEGLGAPLIALAEGCAGLLVRVADLCDRAPGWTRLPGVSIAWCVVSVVVVILAIRRARLADPRPWAGLLAVLAWGAIEVSGAGPGRGVAARVDMLSVGDGSCLLVRAGEDAVLWDAGSRTPGVGLHTIPRALRTLGAPRVRTAVLTHANTDHYSALPDLARTIGLERVRISAPSLAAMRAAPHGSPDRILLERLAGLGLLVEAIGAGDTLGLGPGVLEVLWPPDPLPPAVRLRNDHSLVARLRVPTEAGERRVLLTGDIQRVAMVSVMGGGAEDGAIGADILELPHHGSYHELAGPFARAVGPRVILQSSGPSRLDDPRWSGVRAELGARGGSWMVTARHGAVWAEIRRDGGVRAGAFRSGDQGAALPP